MRLGALEAGGTKMVCAIGNERGEIEKQISLPTETPKITLPKLADFFRENQIEALGIGCFGPVDLNRNSPTYGYITTTPKLAWQNCSMAGYFQKELHIPVGFDTDVNGSALGEATWGASQGLENSMYITIGTGVGAGIIDNGKLVHGMLHPEAGHILKPVRSDDTYAGKCPYHGNCLEGLAAGPSIEKRWGAKAVDLVDKAEVWELESEYLAQAIMDFILTVSPQRIILGGGVMHQMQLFPLIRRKVSEKINGYIRTPELADMDSYIVPASLNDDQGILGCIRLAELSLQE